MTNIGTHTLPLQKRAVAHASAPSRRERDETYQGVIVVLSDRYRVIIDEQGDQFILQKHYAESLHAGVWRTILTALVWRHIRQERHLSCTLHSLITCDVVGCERCKQGLL